MGSPSVVRNEVNNLERVFGDGVGTRNQFACKVGDADLREREVGVQEGREVIGDDGGAAFERRSVLLGNGKAEHMEVGSGDDDKVEKRNIGWVNGDGFKAIHFRFTAEQKAAFWGLRERLV